MSEELRDQDEQGQDTDRPQVSDGYILVMEDATPDPLRLCDFVDGATDEFIQARVMPPDGMRKLRKAAMRTSMRGFAAAPGNRAERRAQKGSAPAAEDGAQEIVLDMDPEGAFVEKCVLQITDYKLYEMRGGAKVARVYDPKRSGDNDHNRATYERMLRPEYAKFQELVEGYLDYCDGRDNDAAEDFAALKNVRRP